MQSFFNTRSVVSYGILRYAKWNYVRAGLLRNLETTKNYYYSRIFSVKSNHFLSRLINTINVSHNHELDRYYDIVDAKANVIAAAMRMTSSLQRGSMFNGVFYGPGCPEIIMTDLDSFNPFEIYKNWKTVSAVKVVMHSRSDLNLLLPNGKQTGYETGLAVITVNIPMLAVQYRAFAADQMYMDKTDGTGLQTVSHFIHRFVLPNMLPSHLDYCIFNRLSNLVNGAPMGEASQKHPFALVDYSSLCNDVQLEIVSDMKDKEREYKSILTTIPAITKQSMTDVLELPANAPTRQITWAQVLSRINALQVMIKLGGAGSVGRNMAILNEFGREFKQYQQDRSIEGFIPRDLYYDTFSEMKAIALLSGKKLGT